MSVRELAGGRFVLERVLGRGGMATVHLARDAELERLVAVKVLAGHLAGDPTFRNRFVREARLAAQLSHPNVVQVFDAGEDGGSPFIVMEYVEGRPLSDELEQRGHLDAERTVDLGVQVCRGLAQAHAAGFVHRDIKPGNLLIRTDGVVKIADFGIARAAETTRLTQMGSVLGTAAYLSPEQALGEEVTTPADIYSLGCVLYQCLSGRTPYVFETLAELALKHRQEPIEPLRELRPELPAGLEAVVMRTLARNPDYRPASAAALGQELADSASEPATRQRPRARASRASEGPTRPLLHPAPPALRGPRSRRGLVLLVALVGLAAAIAIAVAVLTSGGNAGGSPPGARPAPVSPGGSPAEQARNLADWLRSNAG